MLVCIQCAMRAILDGKPAPRFEDEDPITHMLKYYADPAATQRERDAMERELQERFRKEESARDN